MKISKLLYKAARRSRDAKAIASGKVLERLVRKTVIKGTLRLVFGGPLRRSAFVVILIVGAILFLSLCSGALRVSAQDIDMGYYDALEPDERSAILWFGVQSVLCTIDDLKAEIRTLRGTITANGKQLAEIRGRQAVTTGTAAGVPTALAAVLLAWMKKRNGRRSG